MEKDRGGQGGEEDNMIRGGNDNVMNIKKYKYHHHHHYQQQQNSLSLGSLTAENYDGTARSAKEHDSGGGSDEDNMIRGGIENGRIQIAIQHTTSGWNVPSHLDSIPIIEVGATQSQGTKEKQQDETWGEQLYNGREDKTYQLNTYRKGEGGGQITIMSTRAGKGGTGGEGTGFVIDSGTSHTVLRDKTLFTDLAELKDWIPIVTAEKRGEKGIFTTLATHIGNYTFMAEGGGVIRGIAYYAELRENLLGIQQIQRESGRAVSVIFTDKDVTLEIGQRGEGGEDRGGGNTAQVFKAKPEIPARLGGYFIKGEARGGKEDEDNKQPHTNDGGDRREINALLTNLEKAMEIHAKYGHFEIDKINKTIRGGGIIGEKEVAKGVGHRLHCEICAIAKMKKQSRLKTKRGKNELIVKPGHMYAIDRLISPVESMGGATSAIIVIDCGSKYTWAFPMAGKTMAEFSKHVVPAIIADARHQRGTNTLGASDISIVLGEGQGREQEEEDNWMRIRSDGEFATPKIRDMWRKEGFKVETTVPYDSDSNPFVERVIGTLKDATRTALLGAGMASKLWEDGLMMACYTYNAMSHSTFTRSKAEEEKGKGKFRSPVIRQTGKIPNARDMHPSFCPIVAFTTPAKTHIGAWEPRGLEGIFCGWDKEDPHIYLVRLTGGKSVSELLKTNDKQFQEVHRVHHVIFDDFFDSCKNDSPMKRMYRERKETRDAITCEIDGGAVFQFVGDSKQWEATKEAAKSRGGGQSKQQDKSDEEKQMREKAEKETEAARSHQDKSGKVKDKDKDIVREAARGTGAKALMTAPATKTKEIKILREQIHELEILKGKRGAMENERSEERKANRENKNSKTRAVNGGGVLGQIMAMSTTIEDERDDECDDLPEIVHISLGKERKQSGKNDYSGWYATMKAANKEAGDDDWMKISLGSIIDDEKPYAKAKHERVLKADEKEILFNRDERGVFEEVFELPGWLKGKAYGLSIRRTVKEGQGLEGGLKLGEIEIKSRAVVTDIAEREPLPRIDPTSDTGGNYVILTAAFTAKAISKRMLYLLASKLGITTLWQGDFRGAFTNTKVPEWMHIYVRMHPALAPYFTIGTKFLRLRRFLYGLRDAPYHWYHLLMGVLRDFGFTDLGGAFDKCFLVMKTPGGGMCVLLVHTDDLLGFATEEGFMRKVQEHLEKQFKMTCNEFDGEHVYCGFEAGKNREGGWSIGQEKYIEKCMIKLGISGTEKRGGRQLPYGEPISHEDSDGLETQEELEKEFGFRYDRAAGMMVHLIQTRFDLDFSIRQLARFSRNPGRRHYEFMTHFLKYVKANKGARIGYNKGEGTSMSTTINALVAAQPKEEKSQGVTKDERKHDEVETYCDSEFGGHHDKKPIYSYTIYVNGGPLTTESKVATTIQKSTMGAEALGLSDSHDETIHVREWLKRVDDVTGGKFKLGPGTPALYGDNQSVLSAVNHQDGVNTIHAPPHVALKLEAVRQAILDGEITAGKVGTATNMSDIGTKTLPGTTNARASGLVLNDKDNYFDMKFKKEKKKE